MTRVSQLLFGGFLSLFLLFGAFSVPVYAQLDADSTGLNAAAQGTGLETNRSVYQITGTVIDIFLGFLGLIVFLYIIWGGIIWMTANGDSGKVDKARQMIVQAVIGSAIVLAAYAITTFVTNELSDAVTGQTGYQHPLISNYDYNT